MTISSSIPHAGRVASGRQPGRPVNPPGPNLAAAWYIALPSRALRRRPVALNLFDRECVAWRDGAGRAVVMERFCPHQGASLALGTIRDGTLRCPFHGWRFDATGGCVAIPEVERIPPTARIRSYPVREKYGFVWAWYGSAEPLHELPDFPPLAAERGHYVGFRYADSTTGTVRHLLENAVDYYHFLTLHALGLQDVDFQILADRAEAAANGAPIAPAEAWFGVRIHGRLPRPNPIRRPYEWLAAVVSTFGIGEKFELLVDGWPGGQRFTFSVSGQEVYKVLMGISPTGDRATTQMGWAGVRRTGKWWRTLFYFVLFYVQNRVGTAQDVPIYDTTVTDDEALYVRYDKGVIRFRLWYQSWVNRVADPGEPR